MIYMYPNNPTKKPKSSLPVGRVGFFLDHQKISAEENRPGRQVGSGLNISSFPTRQKSIPFGTAAAVGIR